MIKSRVLGAVCACLFAFCVSTQAHAAVLIGIEDNGNAVFDLGSSPGFIAVGIDYVNLAPVTLTFGPEGLPFEDIFFAVNNFTGTPWSHFDIEYTDEDPFAPIIFDFPVITPYTDPAYTLDIGFNEITGFPDAGRINFISPELFGLEVQAFADRSAVPFTTFSITLTPSAVPVPAAVWLFGSGLLGLVGMARRKKSA